MPDTQTQLPQNPLANILNEIVAKLMAEGEQAAEAYAIAMYPELGLPFIKQFLEMFLDWSEQWVSAQTQMTIDAIIFKIQSAEARSDVIDKSAALQIAQKSGDQNAIAKAVQDARDAWDKALKSGGFGTIVSD